MRTVYTLLLVAFAVYASLGAKIPLSAMHKGTSILNIDSELITPPETIL